jgi:hypothetical protein
MGDDVLGMQNGFGLTITTAKVGPEGNSDTLMDAKRFQENGNSEKAAKVQQRSVDR